HRQQSCDVVDAAHAAAHRERHEHLLGSALNDVIGGGAVVDGGGDVEEGDLVRPLRRVVRGEFDGVAHVAQVLEVHALDDAPGGDVETRDDACCEHQSLAAWIADTRMARAPSAYRSSITRFMPLRGIMTRTATHSGSRSGEMVGDSRPPAIATA